MLSNRTKQKGFLARLLEQGIRILLIKECKKIGSLKIDIIASSVQIIKGEIKRINIFAKDINYKYLLFDEIELETSQVKFNFKLTNKEINLKNNFKAKLKISLSENSVKKILLSTNWDWIGNMISKGVLKQDKLENIRIENNQLIMKVSKEKNIIYDCLQINVKAEKGKIYLENKKNNDSIQIPIEDKVYVEKIYIKNNIIIIFANTSISL